MSVLKSKLSDEEKYFYLKLSYIDVQYYKFKRSSKSYTIDLLLQEAKLSYKLNSSELAEIQQLQQEFERLRIRNPSLNDIKLIGYENRNVHGMTTHDDQTGFVGYALEDAEGNRGFLFRGSETESVQDWTDNGAASLTGTSRQIRQALHFFDKYSKDDQGKPLTGISYSVYGHSKGNNLAAEVFVHHLDKDIYGYGVNGQPIHWWDLTGQQKDMLRSDRYTFHVHEGDVVSALGYVDYVDSVVTLRTDAEVDPHSLHSVVFTEHGEFAATQEPDIWRRQLYNLYVTRAAMNSRFALRSWVDFVVDPLNLQAIRRASRDVVYYVVDTLKLIHKHKPHIQLAQQIKEQCIATVARVAAWTRERVSAFKAWWEEAWEVIQIASKVAWRVALRQLGFPVQVTSAPSRPIHVHTGKLRHYANRLQAVQQRIRQVDRHMDRLTDVVVVNERPVTLWYGFRVAYDDELQRCIDFLYEAADRLDHCERQIVQRALDMQ